MSMSDTIARHMNECRECRPWSPCEVATLLLQRMAKLIAPAPVEVIDLPGHRASCTKCDDSALCPIGQAIADAQGAAFIEAGARRVGDKPC